MRRLHTKPSSIALKFFPALLSCFALCFISCSGGMEARIRGSGQAEISLEFSLGAGTTSLLRSFSAVLGQDAGPLLDGPAIAASLAGAPGVAGASLRNRDGSSVAGNISLSAIGQFLALQGAGPVTWDGGGFLGLSLSRETAPALLGLLSPDVLEYLAALMAPCVTGDALSRAEYLELLAQVYGRALANEIAAARVRLDLELPGTVTALRGGESQGRRARFDIPLADILCLENPLRIEVRWNP